MKVTIYCDSRRKTAAGEMPIRLRFQPEYGNAYMISTGMCCTYAPNGCQFPRTEIGWESKSYKLMTLLTQCQDYIYHNPEMAAAKMKDELTTIVTGKQRKPVRLPDMFARFASDKYEGTRKMYERTCRKVLEFDSRADFDTIDKRWLERFWAHLEKEGANTNGIGHHFRNLRAVFNFAIEEEATNNYPFRKFRIRHEQTRKRDLTAEQLVTLQTIPLEPFQGQYRDLFMLMFYLCGINAGDLFLLTAKNINNGRIEYYRQKTKKYYCIRIEPEAWDIINKYRGEKYLLKYMDTNTDYHTPLKHLNDQLKKIGMTYHEGAKWSGDPLFPALSSYYARHSWASIAADLDVPMDTIAQALGHSTPYTTTDIYVNRRLKKIDEANRKVIDFIKGVKS